MRIAEMKSLKVVVYLRIMRGSVNVVMIGFNNWLSVTCNDYISAMLSVHY